MNLRQCTLHRQPPVLDVNCSWLTAVLKVELGWSFNGQRVLCACLRLLSGCQQSKSMYYSGTVLMYCDMWEGR